MYTRNGLIIWNVKWCFCQKCHSGRPCFILYGVKNVSDVCGGVALTEKDGVRIVPDEPCVIVTL